MDLKISRRVLNKAEALEMVHVRRDEGRVERAYQARPFVLTCLPVKRPPADMLTWERRNGHHRLYIRSYPECGGLPFGKDRLTLLWLVTECVRRQSGVIDFRAGADILHAFGLPVDGRQYAWLVRSVRRLFGATIYYGRGGERVGVIEEMSARFLSEIRLWNSRNLQQQSLPGDGFENLVRLSADFAAEILRSGIPLEMPVVRVLKDQPVALDLYAFLVYRAFTAQSARTAPGLREHYGGGIRIKLSLLALQLGSRTSRPRRFAQTLRAALGAVRGAWPACPAELDRDALVVRPAQLIPPRPPPAAA